MQILSFCGRLSRGDFCTLLIVSYFLMAPGLLILLAMFGHLPDVGSTNTSPTAYGVSDASILAVLSLAVFPIMCAALLVMAGAVVRRTHDMGWSGYWPAVLLGIPTLASLASIFFAPAGEALPQASIVNLFLFLLMFAPGAQLPNRFGPPQGSSRKAAEDYAALAGMTT